MRHKKLESFPFLILSLAKQQEAIKKNILTLPELFLSFGYQDFLFFETLSVFRLATVDIEHYLEVYSNCYAETKNK